MPIKIAPTAYDVLCVPTSARASQFLNNVVFHNYFIQYSDAAYNVACHNNSIFDTQPASSDATASHYLRNVVCNNCEKKAFFSFREPSTTWRG